MKKLRHVSAGDLFTITSSPEQHNEEFYLDGELEKQWNMVMGTVVLSGMLGSNQK